MTEFEALYTAAEMRAAEERYAGTVDGADGACRKRGRACRPGAVSARAALDGRVRRRSERRRRAHRGRRAGAGRQGRTRRRRKGGRVGPRRPGRDRRRALRHRLRGRAASRRRGADRARSTRPQRACSRSTSPRVSTRRQARLRVRRSAPTPPSPSTGARSASWSRPAASTRAPSTLPTSGSTRSTPSTGWSAPGSSARSRAGATRDNKYTAGHVLVVGGSPGLTGAPSLTAMAALRADAGYVTLAAPEETLPVFEQRLLEVVKRPLPDDLTELAAKASALAIGPGLGRSAAVHALVRRTLAELALPAVVDADALFDLEPADWPAPRVLTPHEGELARLLGRDSKEIAAHRLASVQAAAERFRCVVLLKGADTLVAAPGRGLLVSALGLPSLATAGTGDVLTGIVAAFLAKGMDAQLAAAAAAVAQQRAVGGGAAACRARRERPDRSAAARAEVMHRSETHRRPGCRAAQRPRPARRAAGRAALGGREGERVRPRRDRHFGRGARRRRVGALRRHRSRGARTPARLSDRAHHRHGAGAEPRGRSGARRAPRARRLLGRRSARRPRAREARHRHGAVGRLASSCRRRSRSSA